MDGLREWPSLSLVHRRRLTHLHNLLLWASIVSIAPAQAIVNHGDPIANVVCESIEKIQGWVNAYHAEANDPSKTQAERDSAYKFL